METKKEYSKESYLDNQQLEQFLNFIAELNISAQEMAEIEGLGNRRETINARLRNKRIKKGFANKILRAKKEQVDKYKNMEFNSEGNL